MPSSPTALSFWTNSRVRSRNEGRHAVERELILATLTLSLCGPALLVSGSTRPLPSSDGCGRELECSRARRLWWPVAIPVLVLSLLLGWALQEPDVADETVGRVVCAVALVFAMIWVRALARAIISLLPRRGGSGARTVGLLRPRIVIERDLALRLDTRELNAVHAHEQAHARHRDPLRIWLAQLVSDLQWPQPRAIARLASWRHALELSRDEEPRPSGVAGAHLPSAIRPAPPHR